VRKFYGKGFCYFRDFVRFLLIILVFSTIFNFWYVNQQRDYLQRYMTQATEFRVLSQQMAKYAGEAVFSQKENVFLNLKSSYDAANNQVDLLKNGETIGGKVITPPAPDKIRTEELERFMGAWGKMKAKMDVILDSQNVIINLNKTSSRLIENLQRIKDIYANFVDELDTADSNQSKTLSLVAHQISLSSDIMSDIKNIVSITDNTAELMKDLSAKTSVFLNGASKIATENSGTRAFGQFSEVSNSLQLVKSDIALVVNIGDITEKIHGAIEDIFSMSPLVENLAKDLESAYLNYLKTNSMADISAYFLSFSSFIIFLLAIYLFQKENAFHLMMIQEKNKAMQVEVEALLKELPDIAGGNGKVEWVATDTTTSALLTESFTYALNTLRKLVHNIGNTARSVSVAAVDAQQITKELAGFSSNQAQEIAEVTTSVSRMAVSIEQVSANAAESASVALDSVKIAGEGGVVVRSTINGMERIQTQIQETSNYMRRLSDSSQEIGEIVSLIDGIADQTNILSLNASIQAAMAGEAGRGFAVVADEVQRLAEKVSYATKEIGSLVRSIQTDTSQVIVAMEQTKQQVQEGVTSAQGAGATLEKIETVSRRLSDLIQNISSSASEQALVSGKISHIMNDVKDIAKQAASGTVKTVDLIGKLMQYVTDLRNSVFEFKLPKGSDQTHY
jgi:twitching motility protein PilJ